MRQAGGPRQPAVYPEKPGPAQGKKNGINLESEQFFSILTAAHLLLVGSESVRVKRLRELSHPQVIVHIDIPGMLLLDNSRGHIQRLTEVIYKGKIEICCLHLKNRGSPPIYIQL